MLKWGAAGKRTLRRTSNSLAQLLLDGNTVAWYGQGLGITVTGAGVSKWADQLGSGHDLAQGTDAARPPFAADGSIGPFNGTAHYLKASAFTLNQPESVYLVWKQITATDQDGVFDGNAANSMLLQQLLGAGKMGIYSGLSVDESSATMPLDTYGITTCVFNGASSLLQQNAGTAVTGNAGANNAGGLTLGAYATADGKFANIQVKEMIVRSSADSAATRLAIQQRLAALHGISI